MSTVSVYMGLGPRGDITEDILRERVAEVCQVVNLTYKERFAFADCAKQEDAESLVAKLNGVTIGSSTLSARLSRDDNRGNAPSSKGLSVFIGLGPRGDITEDDLKQRIAEICEVAGLRVRERFAFVDCKSQEDADALVSKLDGVTINSSTLSVRMSRDDNQGGRGGGFSRGGRGGGRGGFSRGGGYGGDRQSGYRRDREDNGHGYGGERREYRPRRNDQY